MAKPNNFQLHWQGGENDNVVTVSATLATQDELDAVIHALSLVRHSLSSHRAAVAADFGIAERPPAAFRDKLYAMFGDPA